MPRITPISWKKFEKFLLFVGCAFVHQRGSHRVYRRDGLPRPLIVPTDQSLPVFIIRNNLRLLSVSHAEYLEILKRI